MVVFEADEYKDWDICITFFKVEKSRERFHSIKCKPFLLEYCHTMTMILTVLEAVQLPARVSGLDASLADVDGDHFTGRWLKGSGSCEKISYVWKHMSALMWPQMVRN